MKKHIDAITKTQFVRILAKEAGFTYADTKEFLDAFERIFESLIFHGKTLVWKGFCKLYVRDIAPCRAWDNIHKEWYDRGPIKRVVFRLGENLRPESMHKLYKDKEFANIEVEEGYEDEEDLELGEE